MSLLGVVVDDRSLIDYLRSGRLQQDHILGYLRVGHGRRGVVDIYAQPCVRSARRQHPVVVDTLMLRLDQVGRSGL